MAKGLLGKGVTVANTNTKFYTAPVGIQFATVSVNCVNRGTASTKVRVAVSQVDTPAVDDYVEYDVMLEPGGVLERTCQIVSASERVIVWADSANVSVRVSGLEQA